MNITPNSSIMQNSSLANKNVSFNARLLTTPTAKKTLDAGLSNLYSTLTPSAQHYYFGKDGYNFEAVYNRFKNALEAATSNIQGTIKISMNKESKINPEVTFIDKDGVNYSDKHFPYLVELWDMLPNKNTEEILADSSMSNSTKKMVLNCEDAIKYSGLDTLLVKKNPFEVLS